MRTDQGRQSRGARRGGERRGGKFNDRRGRGGSNRDDRPRHFRKGSKDFARKSDRGDERRGGDRQGGDRRRISKDNNGKRGNKREDNKPRDLDSELMGYWVKSGKNQEEGKNVAQQKLNEDMDNYWKQKTEKVEEKPQQ